MESVEDIKKRLKRAGLQATSQRVAICRYIVNHASHPTAEEIKRWADSNLEKVSRATVYNTLKHLVAAKILSELHIPGNKKTVFDVKKSEHHHFVDIETGEVFDLDPDQVEVTTRLGRKFDVDQIEVFIKGKRKKS